MKISPFRLPPPKARAVVRDVAIDTTVASVSAAAGWVNPLLGLGVGAVVGFLAPRPEDSPYAADGIMARPASALFGALCGAAGACGGPLAIPIAGTFGAFRAVASHTLYPTAR